MMRPCVWSAVLLTLVYSVVGQVNPDTAQCLSNKDCPSNKLCAEFKCMDPCLLNLCGDASSCKVSNHIPVCACKGGYSGPLSGGSSNKNGKKKIEFILEKGNLDVHQLVEDLNEPGPGTGCLTFSYCNTNVETVIVNGVNITNVGHKAKRGGKKMFKLYLERLNWFGAVVRCGSNGMALASIESEEEQNAVRNLIKLSDTAHCGTELYCNRWWLGGSDLHDNGNYVWYPNGRPLTYRHFRKSEPNTYGAKQACLDDKEHCIEMVVGSKHGEVWDYEWNDILCTDRLYFVCEYFD